MTKSNRDVSADVLLVTATRTETRAVLNSFGVGEEAYRDSIDGRVYFDLGRVNGARVKLTQSEMGAGGLGASQQAVSAGIKTCSPAAVIMVGIAFGMNEEKQNIGDILVSQQLRLYDLSRVSTQEDGAQQIILRDDKPHASPWLLNHLKSAEITWNGAALRFGTVLTGAKLVDNFDFREQLRALEPEAIGGEMEGAGVYVACHDKKIDWILVKAISDFADGRKHEEEDSRKAIAAKNAATFVYHALQFVPVAWDEHHGAARAMGIDSVHAPTDKRRRVDEQPLAIRVPPVVPLDGFRLLTWNVGGGKFLAKNQNERGAFRDELNTALLELVRAHKPHVVLLQEVVQYEKSWTNGQYNTPGASGTPGRKPILDLENLVCEIPGYYYDFSVAIDTNSQSHPLKWQKYRDKGGWPTKAYLAQGYGLLWHEDLEHAPIWGIKGSVGHPIEKEIIRAETGLFTGSRDTEPRLAVVVHFVLDRGSKPLDVFVVNLHLATLTGEREGSPAKDITASEIRQQQLNIVTNGIVSRYNEWVKQEKLDREPAVWVLGGDFNCMPLSPEIMGLVQRNFIDLNPAKGGGTKGREVPIKCATITLDYLFAGPAYYALDPYVVVSQLKNNPSPLDIYRVSDHFPVRADLPLC